MTTSRFSLRGIAGILLVVASVVCLMRIHLPDAHATASHAARQPFGRSIRSQTIFKTIPIDSLRLGQRIVGRNPNRFETQAASPIDPDTWRTVEFTGIIHGVQYDLAFLRSLEWIQENVAVVGGRVHLSLPELGLDDVLTVAAISPCPAIEPDAGDGRTVVTGLTCHAAAHIVSLEIETSGRVEPHRSHDFATHIAAPQTAFPTLETIECTDNHPIWSVDRQSFVPAGELQPGERLTGVAGGVTGGLATLVRCTPVRGPPQLVYNLEVDGEHVYHVGTTGLLVHNSCGNAGNVDLTTPGRRKHILDGDATGGGHRAGTGNPGKSEFPPDWSDDKIINDISDVATDPSTKWEPGKNGRLVGNGTRDGIDIRVVYDPKTGEIVTGFPTNVPKNPKPKKK